MKLLCIRSSRKTPGPRAGRVYTDAGLFYCPVCGQKPDRMVTEFPPRRASYAKHRVCGSIVFIDPPYHIWTANRFVPLDPDKLDVSITEVYNLYRPTPLPNEIVAQSTYAPTDCGCGPVHRWDCSR